MNSDLFNYNPVLFTLCRRMPSSGQRQHQNQRPQRSRQAILPPQLPAAPLQALLLPQSAPLRPLSRRAVIPLKPLLLPAETMTVTPHTNDEAYHASQCLQFDTVVRHTLSTWVLFSVSNLSWTAEAPCAPEAAGLAAGSLELNCTV